MSRQKKAELIDFLITKKCGFQIRLTTLIQGALKNQFLDDCIKRQDNESKRIKEIVETYYLIINHNPELRDKEVVDIKKIIIKKMKS